MHKLFLMCGYFIGHISLLNPEYTKPNRNRIMLAIKENILFWIVIILSDFSLCAMFPIVIKIRALETMNMNPGIRKNIIPECAIFFPAWQAVSLDLM